MTITFEKSTKPNGDIFFYVRQNNSTINCWYGGNLILDSLEKRQEYREDAEKKYNDHFQFIMEYGKEKREILINKTIKNETI
jgi:hypothetical protein